MKVEVELFENDFKQMIAKHVSTELDKDVKLEDISITLTSEQNNNKGNGIVASLMNIKIKGEMEND